MITSYRSNQYTLDGPNSHKTFVILRSGLITRNHDHRSSALVIRSDNRFNKRSLWPEAGLLAKCKGFKCEPGATACCCRHLLFNQPDFVAQKSQLEELVTRRGHICDFYPKFHPELNFIEQYWGLAKHHYRLTPNTNSTHEMEKGVLNSLDTPTVEQIRR